MFKTLRFTQLDLTLWDFARCFWHPVLVDLIPSGLHRMKKARAENHIAALHNAQSAARRAWQILTGPFVVHEAKAHGARIFQQNREISMFVWSFVAVIWSLDTWPNAAFLSEHPLFWSTWKSLFFDVLRPDFRELYTFGSLIGEGVRISQICIRHTMISATCSLILLNFFEFLESANRWDRPRISVSSTLAMSS